MKPHQATRRSTGVHHLASRLRATLPVGALLLGLGACDPDIDIDMDEDHALEEDLDLAFRDANAPDRNFRALNKPIQNALANLTCQSGAELDKVKNYNLGDHVQSVVYTGPFSDGTARMWYSRSDGATEEYEIKRNKVDANQVLSNGTIDPNGGDISKQDAFNVSGEDHVSQIEWLPDYGSPTSYQAGYLFVAAEDSGDVRIYYYHKNTGDDPTEVTSSSARLERLDGGKINQVYLIQRHGWFWMVMGTKSNFEVWRASISALFPSGAGSLDPTAFSYHGEYSPSSGGGATCYFVEDSLSDIYRLCYYNDDDTNCGLGDNVIYATKVTITDAPSFSISDSVTASVSFGDWGSTNGNCLVQGNGMRYASFRASGTHYVDDNGNLNVYSLAFGGKDSTWTTGGNSDARVKYCSE